MEEEKEKEKQKKIDKKFELRKVMDLDFQAKRNFRFESVKRNEKHDFSENNVLSKLYEHKEHKSHQMAARRDYIVGLI